MSEEGYRKRLKWIMYIIVTGGVYLMPQSYVEVFHGIFTNFGYAMMPLLKYGIPFLIFKSIWWTRRGFVAFFISLILSLLFIGYFFP
ncbi:hypothetical protein HYY69_03885 [Candidatus Woesearchaeota archaeon]|nr:hypothetical protein [Candidatus Woesearchaeota archaeon]